MKVKRKNVNNITIVVLMLAIAVLIGTTLAYFTNRQDADDDFVFSSISLSVDTPFERELEVFDVIPNAKLVEKVAFKKTADSGNMFVRATMTFVTDSTEPTVLEYLRIINDCDFNIKQLEGDVAWLNIGEYYYLTTANKSEAFVLNHSDEIILSDNIIMPDVEQAPNLSQYMAKISLLVKLQAIQSRNVDKEIHLVDMTFAEEFGERAIQETSVDNFIIEDTTITGLTEAGKALQEIIIPSSYRNAAYDYITINELGSGLFKNNKNIKSVTIPATITNIQMQNQETIFEGAEALNKIIVAEGNLVYDSRSNCNAVVESETNKLVFACRTSTIPNTVTSIGDYAFQNILGLVKITIPQSVQSIGYHAFYGCHRLLEVKNLSDCAIESIEWNADSETIGNFHTLNEGFTILGDGEDFSINTTDGKYWVREYNDEKYLLGFVNNTHTIANNIPNDIDIIAQYAFYNSNLTSITIPEGVTKIKAFALSDTKISTITIPSTIDEIGQNICFEKIIDPEQAPLTIVVGDSGLSNCVNLTSIIVNENTEVEPIFSTGAENKYLLSIADKRLIVTTEAEVPAGVEIIEDNAFKGCAFDNIVLPNTVTTIYENAFAGCESLNSVVVNAAFESKTHNTQSDAIIKPFADKYLFCENATIKEGIINQVSEDCKVLSKYDGEFEFSGRWLVVGDAPNIEFFETAATLDKYYRFVGSEVIYTNN